MHYYDIIINIKIVRWMMIRYYLAVYFLNQYNIFQTFFRYLLINVIAENTLMCKKIINIDFFN